jgi:uncharacterized protein (DUF1800 family)
MKQRHIQHLYWRAGFGIGVKKIDQLKSKSKNEIIKDLFYDATKVNLLQLDLSEFNLIKNKSPKVLRIEMGEEGYRKLRQKSQRKVRDLNYAWLERLTEPTSILREKMTLFWSNVFVCRDNHIFHIQHFNNTLRKNALGNFRELVKKIAKEASMSKYLNNRQNRKKSPNENFARELMELFTLGIGNYTEQDIKEAARAFTGWSFKLNGDFVLRKNQHDSGIKTFFDKSGYFDGDDIIDLILEKKQCARFICDKVYRYFVNPIIDESHLDEITAIFYKDYDINNLMLHIFSAKWFYNDKNIGVKIKSPVELLVGIRRVVPVTFMNLQKMMGQVLLYPENVSGWKGGKNWIDSNTLMFRMKLASLILNDAVINLEEKGAFEDSFNKYYNKERKRNRYIKTIKNWDFFTKNHLNLKPNELRDLLIISKLDRDTAVLLNELRVNSNKDFCIQLMSIPEYQLC